MDELGKYQLPKGWSWATIPDLSGKAGIFIDGDWVESLTALVEMPDGELRIISWQTLSNEEPAESLETSPEEGVTA